MLGENIFKSHIWWWTYTENKELSKRCHKKINNPVKKKKKKNEQRIVTDVSPNKIQRGQLNTLEDVRHRSPFEKYKLKPQWFTATHTLGWLKNGTFKRWQSWTLNPAPVEVWNATTGNQCVDFFQRQVDSYYMTESFHSWALAPRKWKCMSPGRFCNKNL